MLDRRGFESLALEAVEAEFQRVPMMREFHTGQWTELEYFKRHLMETVLRIRLNNEVDSYALYKVGSRDDALAGNLAKYLAEEFGHENMFTRDLRFLGVTIDELNATPVFFSTDKLMGYLRVAVDRDGPAATTVWNWFVEWYSDRYNSVITDRAAVEFGDASLSGSRAHLAFDEGHDHSDLMFKVVSRAVERFSTPAKAETYLLRLVNLVGDYFYELHDATVAKLSGGAGTLAGASR